MAEELKTVRELIQAAAGYLQQKGVESARLNAELLLGDILGLSRIDLYLQHDRPVVGPERERFRELIRRRSRGEPLQAIIGTAEFYSRPFKVAAGVFIPRPETEVLVERCVELLCPPDRRLLSPVAVEIGTGSGVIAVSLAAEIPALEVWATDEDPEAVRLASQNARRLGVDARVHVLQGDLFRPLPERLAARVDLLVSNPPYVRTGELAGLPVEVRRHDPRQALDGGADGLHYYRALAAGWGRWLRRGAAVAVEIGADQQEAVQETFRRGDCREVTTRLDLAGLPRVVSGIWDPATGGPAPA
jgi:release factor glutamine methyltransferase